MTKARRFEDLIRWQKARKLASSIYGLTRHPEFSKDFRLDNPPNYDLPNGYQTKGP
jgi:hypothetical protein